MFGAIGANQFRYDKQEDPGATILNTAGDARGTSRFETGKSEGVSGEAGVRARFDTGPVGHEVVVSGSALEPDRLARADQLRDLPHQHLPADLVGESGNSGIARSQRASRDSSGCAVSALPIPSPPWAACCK